MAQSYKFSIKDYNLRLTNTIAGKETIYHNDKVVSILRAVKNSLHEFSIGEDKFSITIKGGIKFDAVAKLNDAIVPVIIEKQKVDLHQLALVGSFIGLFTFRKVIFGNAHMAKPGVGYTAIVIIFALGIWGGYNLYKKNKNK